LPITVIRRNGLARSSGTGPETKWFKSNSPLLAGNASAFSKASFGATLVAAADQVCASYEKAERRLSDTRTPE
jgi:hypothetical protein